MATPKKKHAAPVKSKSPAKKVPKPVAKSSPKTKSKSIVKPAKKDVPKAKAKAPAKRSASPLPASKAPPAKKIAKTAAPKAPVHAAKKAPVKSTVSEKTSKPSPVSVKTAAGKSPAAAKKSAAPVSAREQLRSRILAQKTKPAKPVAFSLDEIREVAKTNAKSAPVVESAGLAATGAKSAAVAKVASRPTDSLRAAVPAQIKAASLADILGFNPKQKASHAENEESLIPEKFKRYYKLLIELRNHVTGQVDQHAEETLKRSAKDDSGDLSSYGTDGGTDSFDRDFALSLVANEQEALAEVEAAIQRIKHGNYGICEHTQKPISKERLLVVPFTRYTAESLKEIEKTRYKVRGQTGILGEGEEGAKVEDDSGGDE
jgi:RNA polymerase-binding transcription factor DksA